MTWRHFRNGEELRYIRDFRPDDLICNTRDQFDSYMGYRLPKLRRGCQVSICEEYNVKSAKFETIWQVKNEAGEMLELQEPKDHVGIPTLIAQVVLVCG